MRLPSGHPRQREGVQRDLGQLWEYGGIDAPFGFRRMTTNDLVLEECLAQAGCPCRFLSMKRFPGEERFSAPMLEDWRILWGEDFEGRAFLA